MSKQIPTILANKEVSSNAKKPGKQAVTKQNRRQAFSENPFSEEKKESKEGSKQMARMH